MNTSSHAFSPLIQMSWICVFRVGSLVWLTWIRILSFIKWVGALIWMTGVCTVTLVGGITSVGVPRIGVIALPWILCRIGVAGVCAFRSSPTVRRSALSSRGVGLRTLVGMAWGTSCVLTSRVRWEAQIGISSSRVRGGAMSCSSVRMNTSNNGWQEDIRSATNGYSVCTRTLGILRARGLTRLRTRWPGWVGYPVDRCPISIV